MLKDHGGKPGAVFGDGEVKWAEVFEICETIGGTRRYIIEEEGRQGLEALAAVRRGDQQFPRHGQVIANRCSSGGN